MTHTVTGQPVAQKSGLLSNLTIVDWGLWIAILGLSPLLLQHAYNLSARPHFQFFPLAWALFAAVVYLRGGIGPMQSQARAWAAMLFATAAVVVAILALIRFSPWLAHMSLVLVCLAWMYARLAASRWYQPLAWISLLLITLPLPKNGDMQLIQNLQTVSTRSTSLLMDFTRIPHLQRGNVLEVRTGELFVDEACSGVDSLYSLAAIALGIVIWQQRSCLPSVLTLLSVPLWAWFGNLLRLYTIAFMLDRFQIDLAHGWQHALLGVCLFGVSCSCLLATQSLASELFKPFPIKTVTSNSFHAFYNAVVCWPGDDPAKAVQKRGKKSVASKRESIVEDTSGPTSETRTSAIRTKVIVRVASTVFVVVGMLSSLPLLRDGIWRPNIVTLPNISEISIKRTFDQPLLANAFDGLTCVDFSTILRDMSSAFGEHSATWYFRDGDRNLSISLDFPFNSFHGLEQCYLAAGQNLVSSVMQVNKHADDTGLDLEIHSVRLVDQFNEESYLCYVNFGRNGSSVTEKNGIIFQAQVFVQGCGQLNETDRDKYHVILAKAVQLLLPKIEELLPES